MTMMMNDVRSPEERPVVLSVNHVAKSFKLPTEQASGLKQAFLNWTKGIKGYTEQKVLKDISFEVHQGDFFGIVGRNGSGKSTLLKIISGIYVPEKGTVDVRGKLVPFIELGVGFNPELTGRENVYLNGALLGFSHDEIDAMYDDIVEFAELEQFMDQKLKNYSSGMQVRLAFSVAIKAQGDILVLDEVLAVGDEAFQRKCDNYFAEVKKDPTKTVILVTHSMDSVKKYCNKAILVKNGEIIVNGDKNDVADQYTLENLTVAHSQNDGDTSTAVVEKYPAGLNSRVPVLQVRAISSQVCVDESPFCFSVDYEFHEDRPFFITLTVLDLKRGGIVYDSANQLMMKKNGKQSVKFEMPIDLFMDGEFRIQASLRTIDDANDFSTIEKVAYTNEHNSCIFVIRNPQHRGKNNYGLLSNKIMKFRQI